MGKKSKVKVAKDGAEEKDESKTSPEKAAKRKLTTESADSEPAEPKKKVKKQAKDSIVGGTTIAELPGIKIKQKESKRAKKRKKREEAVQEKPKEQTQEEIRSYLECWNSQREKWKFQKLKQIFIQKYILDENHIDGDLWPVALEYLSGTKGASRDLLIKNAETVISEIDAAAEENESDTQQTSTKYQRARELLQSLG
uniref:WKF domain-containing protein n=1 Tax=Anopheles triannulatus TaxID=58253 RepID=A0A2M4ATQ3_9DIPT